MTSWLTKQKKQTLWDLSSEAGLRQNDDLRKDELVENLDTYLRANATRLSRNATFEPYYGTRRTPFKARSSSAAGAISEDGELKSVVKARGRRTTQVKQDVDDDGHDAGYSSRAVVPASTTTIARTPGRPRKQPQLPASPADVADEIEYATGRMYAGIDSLYERSGIPDKLYSIREACSSVVGVQMTFLLLEALALQRQLLGWTYAGISLPSVSILGFDTWAIPLYVPDFFHLLTAEFWSTSLLWTSTSVVIPMIFAYFYNLSTRDVKRHGTVVTVARYRADPLIFSVAKALTTIVVYEREYTFGLFDSAARANVNDAVFLGFRGMLLGSYVGVVAALYEAAQRK
ncbi:hypothetical protein LTR37_002781 [Vermiconidia calcicola]|uniref:Uncharacterized protein n=1 Tax=Vermiconidia calcicola TaxID=1690605 RepID=A0ACC3NTG8_9PEZI|nr:hypothetical protein LTR37_002781 [Vermiconidia calcicola]